MMIRTMIYLLDVPGAALRRCLIGSGHAASASFRARVRVSAVMFGVLSS